MSEQRQELWLIRHGETEWSATRRHTGRTDIALTPIGERQAAALGRHLAGRSFALVLCSPLWCASDTCRLAGYGEAANMTDDLIEWDYGLYEGRTTNEIRTEMPGWSIWAGNVPGGETIEQVGRRAERVLQRAAATDGRMGRPEEIAAAVLWMCSDAAAFMIGHAMVMDGGQTVQ